MRSRILSIACVPSPSFSLSLPSLQQLASPPLVSLLLLSSLLSVPSTCCLPACASVCQTVSLLVRCGGKRETQAACKRMEGGKLKLTSVNKNGKPLLMQYNSTPFLFLSPFLAKPDAAAAAAFAEKERQFAWNDGSSCTSTHAQM